MTKVSLELSGNAPVITMNNADRDLAVNTIVESRMTNTGQRYAAEKGCQHCAASSVALRLMHVKKIKGVVAI